MALANDYMINEFKQFFQINSLSSSTTNTTTTSGAAVFKNIISNIQKLAWIGTLCKEGKHVL